MALLQARVVYRYFISNLVVGVSLIALLTHCNNEKQETLPFYNTADFTAEWINESDPRFTDIHTIDTFSMIDQSGKGFTTDSLKGRIYVANFFFTLCPSICPKMTNELRVLQSEFANDPDIELVSFSVMPSVDSVSILKEYAERNKIIHDKWHLLTGDALKIKLLGRKSYFAEKKSGEKKAIDDFLHTENAVLIDKQSRIRGVYNATQKEDILRLIDDIKILQLE